MPFDIRGGSAINDAIPTAEQTSPRGPKTGVSFGKNFVAKPEAAPTTVDDPPSVASVSKGLFS